MIIQPYFKNKVFIFFFLFMRGLLLFMNILNTNFYQKLVNFTGRNGKESLNSKVEILFSVQILRNRKLYIKKLSISYFINHFSICMCKFSLNIALTRLSIPLNSLNPHTDTHLLTVFIHCIFSCPK